MRSEDMASVNEPMGALTVNEFCKTYRIGRNTFYNELKTGRLSAKKAGKKTLVLKSEAQRWERSLPDFVPQ